MASLPVLNNQRDLELDLDPERTDLAARLRTLLGEAGGEVRFSQHDRMLYATDASLYQVEPLGVVVPRSIGDAERVVKWCGENSVAVLPRGGGTSLAGQCTSRAVVLDLSAHCRRIDIVEHGARKLPGWPELSGFGTPAGWVFAEPGVAVDELNRELIRRGTGMFFAPDPATTAQASIGGCLGNNAAGARSIRYGRTSENVGSIECALSTGERVWLGPGAGAKNPAAARLAAGAIDIARRHEHLIRERYPKTIRQNAGYGLDRVLKQMDAGATADTIDLSTLLCGSEGTLATTLRAMLALRDTPRAKGLAVLSFATLEESIDAVQPLLDAGRVKGLSAVELLDDVVLGAARGNLEARRYVQTLPGNDDSRGEPKAVLYIEFFGTGDSAAAKQQVLAGLELIGSMAAGLRVIPGGVALHTDEGAMLRAWKLRKAGEPLLHGLPGARKPITFVEDNAVPVERLGEFVREFKKIVAHHGTRAAYWAHASVGVLHVRPMIDLHDEKDRERMREIAVEVADLARSVGGVMSGEHGDGRVRGPLLERFYGPELMSAFREVKKLFDPRGILNPGNIIAPGPIESITENLRTLAARASEPEIKTYFEYEDQHGFQGAVEMCNGAGVCRKRNGGGGTMCPSYMATLDERHATRGRGNALRLAITGQIGRDGSKRGAPAWNDPDTNETLRLCLSCKACKSECPSNVDIARLKAEYTAQGYRERGGSPLSAKVFGHVRTLNRLGSLTPALANATSSLAPMRWLMERTLKIDRRRSLPPFERSLYSWWNKHQRTIDLHRETRGRVVLFADCFTTYNEPRIGRAAVLVLEHLGYQVDLLPTKCAGGFGGGCCGRAMISTGLLDDAIETIDNTLAALRPAIDDDNVKAIVACEPSCLSAIKDDWLQLKVKTPRGVRQRLAEKSFLVEDFAANAWDPGRAQIRPECSTRNIVLHGHCHQKALWGAETSARLLRAIAGPERVRVLDSGCCGMAGSFGFTTDRYELSMRIGELSLIPAVRGAGSETVIVAPGTSCRHQVHDATGARAVHPIEFAAGALGIS